MGPCNSNRASLNEAEYFNAKRKKINSHFTRSQTFLSNSSEWVVIFKEEFRRFLRYPWSHSISAVINSWNSFNDTSSRVVFLWDELKPAREVLKVNQSKTCDWRISISSLQTFSYEVESNPYKKILNKMIQHTEYCTIYKLIREFKHSIFNYYCRSDKTPFIKESMLMQDSQNLYEEIDNIILDFIKIIVKILPIFFIDFPSRFDDVEDIVRNAVISGNIFDMLLNSRKSSFEESQKSYLQGLKEFDCMMINSPVAERLIKEDNENYQNAIKCLLEIPTSQSIGQVHDYIAMLMNYISMGLYNENEPSNILEEDEVIQAFLLIVGKSSVIDLPLYVDILNTFLDNKTLNIKSIGQGIVKLTYIIDNSTEWSSFLTNF